MPAIKKLLIANRGEIAVRIMSTCREMGIRTVAVFADPDRTAMHVHAADEAFALEGSRIAETYLNAEKIVSAARRAGADAIHPGYGFLSENSGFAKLVTDSGLRFVGPPPEAIALLGDKTSARALARKLEIPVLGGSPRAFTDKNEAKEESKSMKFPILLKAAAGGGGKGMRLVASESDLPTAFELSSSEAMNAFGDPRIYLEQFLSQPHHVEIQVLMDEAGNGVSLGERDCSTQRRHQKMIEESPSPVVDEDLRARMSAAAIRLMKAAGYRNAGTVEFLVDPDGNFYFLEVNTRLQVEHPVTEAVTGLDLVKQQILVASQNELAFRQEDIRQRGHAIECRVYAEDPSANFMPSVGTLRTFQPPLGPGVRVDSGARSGDVVGVHYDPLLAKVTVWGDSRKDALARMTRALNDFAIVGVETTIPFCRFVLQHKIFVQGNHHTQLINEAFIASYLEHSNRDGSEIAAIVAATLFAMRGQSKMPAAQQELKSRWKTAREEHLR